MIDPILVPEARSRGLEVALRSALPQVTRTPVTAGARRNGLTRPGPSSRPRQPLRRLQVGCCNARRFGCCVRSSCARQRRTAARRGDGRENAMRQSKTVMLVLCVVSGLIGGVVPSGRPGRGQDRPAVRVERCRGQDLHPRRRQPLLRDLRFRRAAAARPRQRFQHRVPDRPDRSLPQAVQGGRHGQPRPGQVRRQRGRDHLREDPQMTWRRWSTICSWGRSTSSAGAMAASRRSCSASGIRQRSGRSPRWPRTSTRATGLSARRRSRSSSP